MAPGRAVLLLGLLLILQLWARDAEAAPQRDRSSSVPGGLRTWQAPQFVLLVRACVWGRDLGAARGGPPPADTAARTRPPPCRRRTPSLSSPPPRLPPQTHDDALDAPSYKLVHQIVAGLKNSNGCAIPATFFLTAAYSSCKVVQGAYAAGHEIAAHTLHHPHMRELSAAKQIKEVLGLRDYARKCGVPAAAVQGYRSPYLESSPTQLATLKLAGYRFDSSQSELWPGTAKNRSNWPYTLDNGLRACGWAPAGTCTGTRAPGVWEVPLYYFTVSLQGGRRGGWGAAAGRPAPPADAPCRAVRARSPARMCPGGRAWTRQRRTRR